MLFFEWKISTSPRLIPVAFLGLARFTFWGPSGPVVDGWIPCHGWMDGSAGKKGLVISGLRTPNIYSHIDVYIYIHISGLESQINFIYEYGL